jgi:hypothetical protein
LRGSSPLFTSNLSTCLLDVRIYPIHIKIIGVVQWYVLCPILSFFCELIIFIYIHQAWLCMPQIEFGDLFGDFKLAILNFS